MQASKAIPNLRQVGWLNEAFRGRWQFVGLLNDGSRLSGGWLNEGFGCSRQFVGLLNDGSRLSSGWLSKSFVLDWRLVACGTTGPRLSGGWLNKSACQREPWLIVSNGLAEYSVLGLLTSP